MRKSSILVGGMLVIGLAVVGWNYSQPAPETQAHSMVPPDTTAIAQGAPIVDVKLPSEFSAEAQIGMRGFEA